MKTIFGIKGFDIHEFAISANAILGIRDSGKTYAGCEAAEELFDAGIPSICFDPIGKWHALRIPGKGKGYPFVVAGGRYADLPLTRKNCTVLVKEAMKSGVSLVLDLFSKEMSKADWRYIVQACFELLLYENEDHGLRHIFIEEAGEFVPQRVQDGKTFSAVEQVVRMGGNSKLGCTLIHQRPADINKSVLELCANILLLRQSGKNTLTDLKKWLAMVAEDQAKEIGDSLHDLNSGKGWLFATSMKQVTKVQVPARNSKHPDRREQAKAPEEVRKGAVPADKFVDAMKAALEPKAPPPKPAQTSKAVEKISTVSETAALKDRERAFAAGKNEGFSEGYGTGWLDGDASGFTRGANAVHAAMKAAVTGVTSVPYVAGTPPKRIPKPSAAAATETRSTEFPKPTPQVNRIPQTPVPRASANGEGLGGPQQRILNSLATWRNMGHDTPSNAQVAWLARYSPSSTSYTNPRGALNSSGLICYPMPDCVGITGDGLEKAEAISIEGTLLDFVLAQIPGPEARILRAAASFYPDGASNEDVAAGANYSASSTSYTNPRGALKTKDLITYPSNGMVRAADWLFTEGA